jgi:transcriptional regulator with XRE-family HTH domain
MEQDAAPLSPTQVVAKRVREVRERRRMTAAKLAAEMTRVGIPWDRGTVAKLETGRRANVSVAELLALAYVLAVAPVHLLVPLEDKTPYQATPTQVEPAGAVRDWVRGAWYIDGVDVRGFFAELPPHEYLPPDRRRAARVAAPARTTYAERLGRDPEWLREIIEKGGPGAASARRALASLESELESEQQQAPDG